MKLYRFLIIGIATLTLSGGNPVVGQSEIEERSTKETEKEDKSKKAWEIGVGGTVFQFNRVQFSNFSQQSNGSYTFDLGIKSALFGGNLYLARELNKYLYLDLQGSGGITSEKLGNSNKDRWMFMVQPGLQWRFGEYFGSKYIDPYLRAGVGYMYKGFDINYIGTEGLTPDEMQWMLENNHNKDGADRKHLMPVSVGAGLNTWLNDRIGIGLQADYVVMPYKNVANSLQGTVRVMWRIGGKTKKSPPVYRDVERIVETIVEKPVIVEKEKIVEVRGEGATLLDFFNNINFEFDKATLMPSSVELIDQVAEILKKDTGKRYLITGYTDAKGSAAYNLNLSKKRAAAVVEALIARGVPPSMLKSRGVGQKISYADRTASDKIREADRKVTIEIITNTDYWNYIPSK